MARDETGQGARRELGRFFRFLLVGSIGFVVDTGSLSIMVLLLSLDRQLAKGLAFCLAVLSNFVWNRYFTYRDSRSKSVLSQVWQFALISLVGLGINLLVFGIADAALRPLFGSIEALYAAQAAAVGTALLWNFAANRIITYGDVKLGH
ncbi:MAG TPA: GtrA family protein [Polyangiaceae bacterium]|nr:GtrA family protein [Polyangiaceae bacterium]